MEKKGKWGKIAAVCALVGWGGFFPAAAAQQVNLYTDRQEVFLRPVLDEFTRQHGIVVKVLAVKKGLLERMKAEGERSPADVVLAADIGVLLDFVAAGLTQPSKDEVFAVVPPVYRGDNGHWVAVTRRARILYTKPNSGINTYDDLARAKDEGGICSRSGLHPYNIALFADMIYRKGEAGAASWLRSLKDNLARTPRGNDRAQIKGVLKGECGVAIANSYYYFHWLAGAEESDRREIRKNIRVVFPPRAHFNITGMARAKHAPHPLAALRLMKFLLSGRAQEIYAGRNFEFPVRADAAYPPMLSPYRRFLQESPPPIRHIAELRRAASRLVDAVAYDR